MQLRIHGKGEVAIGYRASGSRIRGNAQDSLTNALQTNHSGEEAADFLGLWRERRHTADSEVNGLEHFSRKGSILAPVSPIKQK